MLTVVSGWRRTGYREWGDSLLEEGTMGLVSPLPHHVWHKQPLGTYYGTLFTEVLHNRLASEQQFNQNLSFLKFLESNL